ncbi:hypothetical protein BX666DRAFT_1103216 [Dichotomocladium elegans]|nr:hypothetical protein BX666DRAFT_1103216 [Dichotomocladium elegans]
MLTLPLYKPRVKELKGESDPRLLSENQGSIRNEVAEHLPVSNDEIVSQANSDNIWDDDQTENLMDIDFPSQMSANALETPKSHQPWADRVAEGESPLADRQQTLMRRLSSPPDEVFELAPEEFEDGGPSAMADLTLVAPPAPQTEKRPDPSSVVRQIRETISLHRAQIRELDTCIQREKRLVSNLSLVVASHHEENDFGRDEEDYAKTISAYQTYLKDLDDVLDEKSHYVEALRERIKTETKQVQDNL